MAHIGWYKVVHVEDSIRLLQLKAYKERFEKIGGRYSMR